MRSKFAYLILALCLIVADQASKVWATLRLKPVMTMEVMPGYFRLSYATNRGVAFSLFADSSFDVRWIFAAISILAAVFVLSHLWRAAAGQRRLRFALALLLSGIIGNLIDRIRLGEVVDFIELHWRDQYAWPTFNVADSAICAGAVLLAIEMIWEARADPAPAATE
ncbi:MAG: signal peptidase II [Blastocatellia bacterium]